MKIRIKESACSSPQCGCNNEEGKELDRREFIKRMGLGVAGTIAATLPVMAGPFEKSDLNELIPADKKLNAEWVKSLFARGARTIYKGNDLKYVGMPIGGICAGQLYLGGDGKLWYWDIFNEERYTDWSGKYYQNPREQESPLEQGFAISINSGEIRKLDSSGFTDISFAGEYPMGFVTYKDNAVPVTVSLEAFSPFIPLNPDDSSIPVTIMRFTIKNERAEKITATIGGWLENATCINSQYNYAGNKHNQMFRDADKLMIHCLAESQQTQTQGSRPVIAFAEFEGDSYGDWKPTGSAFGSKPMNAKNDHQNFYGVDGDNLVSSYPPEGKDKPLGKLISPSFVIERTFINFLIGGGNHPQTTAINLIIDNKIVRSETGRNSHALRWEGWDVSVFEGKTAHIEIVDNESGSWAFVIVDKIEFADKPRFEGAILENRHDYGTLGIALLEPTANDTFNTDGRQNSIFTDDGIKAKSTKPFGQKLLGSIQRDLTLEAGQEEIVTFVITWHFPNLRLPEFEGVVGRYYTTRFKSAAAVADYVAKNYDSLYKQTKLWHNTWYNSTLPYWFLDRTFINTSILASSTCHWFSNGRFYGWEGVGCCAGTCNHVWQYAQAVGRVFPSLERDVRERVDFGSAFNEDTGMIFYRGKEASDHAAHDGQAGTVLRAYREHQMTADATFLKNNWPHIKKSLEFLMNEDKNDDGVFEGPQYNTLDASWYGKVAWISLLYVAALKAGEAMAKEMNDQAFAERANRLAESGSKKIVKELWNGEYFIHKGDANHLDSPGSYKGCEIDQVFGQSYAHQVGLGRILPEKYSKKALQSLWRYNFAPDIAPYRKAFPEGRWYALSGEGGLLMCTFPQGGGKEALKKGEAYAAGYFNECMTGFEYQVASHMIWEGLVLEGLAITRTIHDRYHASKRNPYNEIECGDHYSRAMASYGVFLASGGYEYHGNKGYLAFAPKINPENFRTAFTVAEGWGTYQQRTEENKQIHEVNIKWGRLQLKQLQFDVLIKEKPSRVVATLNGAAISVKFTLSDEKIRIHIEKEVLVDSENIFKLEVV